MKPSITELKAYLGELLTADTEYKNKGTKEEARRVKRIIIAAEAEKEPKENVFECFQKLIEFLEINNITDESADNGDGCIDEWRSTEFNNLISNAKEELKELAHLPYSPNINTKDGFKAD